MEFEAVIGLEVHAQLKTRTKMFCADSTEHTGTPNKNVCPVCLGMPGALPVINKKAVEYAIMAALAFNCRVNTKSIFARKNYFYPDLPKGYQISQFDKPLAEDGNVTILNNNRTIEIERIHLEEDAGKSIHDKQNTLIDYNRTGIPLIEIVSRPQLKNAKEAVAYLKKLHQTLLYLGICDGNLEKGNFRCDANISVRAKDSTTLGTKVELKNINSFRFVKKGIEFEIERQIGILKNKQTVRQQTRLFNNQTNSTYSIREKEETQDYRYFPEPDLLPLVIDHKLINEIKSNLPELPDAKRKRLSTHLKLSDNEVSALCNDLETANYFEKLVESGAEPKACTKWLLGYIANYIKTQSLSMESFPLAPDNLAELIRFEFTGKITRVSAEKILLQMIKEDSSAQDIITKKPQYLSVNSEAELKAVVEEIIDSNPALVEKYKSGKTRVFGAIMGKCMQATNGNADPATLKKLLLSYLD